MSARIKFIHHLGGISAAASILFLASHIFRSEPVLQTDAQGLTSNYYRLVSAEDFIGLARVAAARAIDGREIALAYPKELACKIAGDTSLPEANTALRVGERVTSPSTYLALGKGGMKNLAEICYDNQYTGYFLTTSNDIRREAQLLGVSHPYIALAVR